MHSKSECPLNSTLHTCRHMPSAYWSRVVSMYTTCTPRYVPPQLLINCFPQLLCQMCARMHANNRVGWWPLQLPAVMTFCRHTQAFLRASTLETGMVDATVIPVVDQRSACRSTHSWCSPLSAAQPPLSPGAQADCCVSVARRGRGDSRTLCWGLLGLAGYKNAVHKHLCAMTWCSLTPLHAAHHHSVPS
jgi:hypothetical protein